MGLRALLRIPSVYTTFKKCVGYQRRNAYVEDYVKPLPGMRVLDLGCGPGDLLVYFPQGVEYTGIDISAQYIAAAQNRFGPRAKFLVGSLADAGLASAITPKHFDVVLFKGVLHHLTDAEAHTALTLAREALKPDGRVVTFDGCFVAGQSPIARLVLNWDRGRFVRNLEGYRKLLSAHFGEVDTVVRHDLLRIPYTHLIATARRPRAATAKARGAA